MTIPGPRILPVIGSAWTYLPCVGTDSTKSLYECYMAKYLKYGKIVRERIVDKDIVSVYDPDDIEKIFNNEGRWPQRISHEVLLAVRRKHPELYSSGGLVPTNGEEWSNLRNAFQKEISRPANLSQYVPVLESTSREFVDHLLISRDHNGIVPDLLYKMHEWALENVCVTVLDTRLGHFGANRNPICHQLIDSGKEFLFALHDAERLPFWRLFKTKSYRTVEEMELFFYKFFKAEVDKKMENNLNKTNADNGGILDKYLKNSKNDVRDVIVMASDLVFAGLLTTAFTMSFALYHLSRNVVQQQTLFAEVSRLRTTADDQGGHLNLATLGEMSYLKACVKETLRLNPVALGIGRNLSKNLHLDGHYIPAGTMILTQNQVASRLPEYVSEPLLFRPERWLRSSVDREKRQIHPYLVLPFGMGPRACIGRRFAELEMYIFLCLLVKKFRMEWIGSGELLSKSILINVPVGKMNIKFIPRT